VRALLRPLLSLAVVLAITALLLELALRALALLPGRAGGLASDPDVGIIGMPHVAHGALVTNARGFNDRGFATAALPPKAVFVGDSFTFGVTPFAESFPHRVEELMGGPDTFRVVNLGVPATGPQEYLAMIRRRALPMRPEWVVVILFVGNDIRQAHPDYRTLIFLGGARSMYDPLRLGTEWSEYYLARVLRTLAQRYLPGAPIAACATSPATAARLNPFLLNVYERELEIYDVAGVARVKDALAGMSDLVGQMANSTAASGARVLFVLAPSELQLDQNLRDSVLRCLGKRATRYDFLQPQRLLGEQLATQGLPHLDLWPALSRYPTSATYMPLDTHWNAFGNEVAAEAIAAKLKGLRAAQSAR
jgi:SGNH hydrolase-like domain, acetyltransferase AlgX